MTAPPRGRGYWGRAGLALASTLATLLILELAVRLATGSLLDPRNRIAATRDHWRNNWVSRHDPELGWIPRPGTRDRANAWGVPISIGPEGIRENGEGSTLPERPSILALGDSFTFGDEVGDAETWPARLEELLGVRVANAGVFAYGLDQIVLRAERLGRARKPDLLIVAFIPQDVNRLRFSRRAGAAKPWFEIQQGALVLHGVPVPPPAAGLGALRRSLGYSALADWAMRRAAPEYWLAGPSEDVLPESQAVPVACLLMDRLGSLQQELEAPVLVVSLAAPGLGGRLLGESVLACAARRGLATLDLFATLAELASRVPDRFESLFGRHLTAAGNRFVAERIAAAIARQGLVPRS